MPFWFGLKEKREKEKQELQKPEMKFDAKYLGGHKAYPTRKEVKAKILVFADRIEIYSKLFVLTAKFNQMMNVDNLGSNTIIEYNDGMDIHALNLNFGKHLEKMQPVIYHKMIGARLNKE